MKFEFAGYTVPVTHADAESMLSDAARRLADGRGFALATLNLDHLVKLARDVAFRSAYVAQDMIVADGHPIVWLSRIAGSPVSLVPGADMVLPLVRRATACGRPTVIVGSSLCALQAASAELARLVPGTVVPLVVSPTFGFDPTGQEARAILEQIAGIGPCLCLVALGAPKQERFAALGRTIAPQAGFASIGAGVDFLAGIQLRAPLCMRRLALEWLWRLMLSPRRLGMRYLSCFAILPAEVVAALRHRLSALNSTLQPDP